MELRYLAFLATMFLCACATYDGPSPAESARQLKYPDMAVVLDGESIQQNDLALVSRLGGDPGLDVCIVDSKSTRVSAPPVLWLRPGSHTFTLCYQTNWGLTVYSASAEVTKELESGRTYIAHSEKYKDDEGWLSKDMVRFGLIDYGPDFPRHCLPWNVASDMGFLHRDAILACVRNSHDPSTGTKPEQ